MNLKVRLDNLRRKFVENGIDAIFISQPENRYYLSGFYGSDGFLLITPQDTVLATDFRYIEQAERQSPGYNIFRIIGGIAGWFPELVSRPKLKRLGFEVGDITLAQHQQLVESLRGASSSLELIPVNGLVESLRILKEDEEIELITEAAAISDRAIEYIREVIHFGMTEKEVAWEIEKFMREQGSQKMPFDVIVASGSNSALPHAQPSEHAIQSGEPIIIDIGARIGGYGSDLTRTLCLGPHDDTFTRIYGTVLKAQLAAMAGIREGMTGEEADSLAREIIEKANYGEAFGHSLGHGIGLVPHELPRLGPGSEEHLINRMVFSIEPGIYLSGWGGVRIEDTVVLENGKTKVISAAKK